MEFPEPVISVAVEPKTKSDQEKMGLALQRLAKEDPSFRVATDQESGQTIISGMGELHLEIYVERIRREYNVEVKVGAPKVHYREAPTQPARFDLRHRKQTGGAGQYAHVIGRMEVLPEDAEEPFVFEDQVIGGRIPRQFIPAVEKGFRQAIAKGPVAGCPVVGLHVILEDGSYHEVDSSDLAFQICAQTAMRETFLKTRPVLLEPVMKIEIECPGQFQGPVVGDLTARRGLVAATEADGPNARIEGEVPLAETFGYATDLRSMTQGQGTFTLEFARYRRMPPGVEREVIAERKKGTLAGVL
jgi:elongation factor G